MASRMSFSRNRNSWGPISVTSTGFYRAPDDDDNDDEIKSIQAKQLDPLKEDLADWLNKTLGIEYINKDNFLEELDNGVVLCHLAQIITGEVKKALDKGLVKGPLPKIRGKCFEKAARGSFYSRDNMENFIRFCRSLGVHENLLFESEDLVLHHQPRNVILCLLEVARIASKFGIEPPGLVQLEKQIAEEERDSFDSRLSSLLSWQFPNITETTPNYSKMKQSYSAGAISSVLDRWNSHHVVLVDQSVDLTSISVTNNTSGASDGVPSDNTEDEEWSRGSGEDPDLDVTPPTRPSSGGSDGANTPSPSPTNELDRKVQLAARLMQKNCNCSSGRCERLKIRKVGEGKYNIAGKNVFVRLLKGRHMMVRVGGGWDTLDHFLLRHDPCQVKVVSRESPDRPTNASKYLHIRAKYRSPPPRESITR
ncbi:growth arrest-specific protein 2-like [Diorhabda carinulata]|uniref:growth arrest-specific protein 2-like n=1 Tax=Diorhabda carinulata TaxID=1163345 RepID=UPI0025A1044E|nr:growth arrest-specific protein 2-like [Diorhabda carinulata]XP_057669641.1 growth arrest-specific protein 2-like [Diorhabda carinulata]